MREPVKHQEIFSAFLDILRKSAGDMGALISEKIGLPLDHKVALQHNATST